MKRKKTLSYHIVYCSCREIYEISVQVFATTNIYVVSLKILFGLVIRQIFHHKRATSGCMMHVKSAPPCGTCTAVHVSFLFFITHCPNGSLVTFFQK